MPISKLSHYSIRTRDLEASRRFYTDIMGLRSGSRPPFAFPGIWLYLRDDESKSGVVHIIGVDPDDPSGLTRYLGDKPIDAMGGTGTFDHIAFLANGWPAMRERCRVAGVRYEERTVPSLGLHQVFVVDPSGVTIELNYPASEAGTPGVHDPSDPEPSASIATLRRFGGHAGLINRHRRQRRGA